MNKPLPYGHHWIDEDDIEAVVKVLKSEFLTTGPVVKEFEEKLADYVGARYAVAVSSGTAALHAACFAAEITEGDEVITTPMTFAATSNVILYYRGKPVFADINPETCNINPAEVRKKVSPRTKAIIPVHFTGQPCDMDAILEIARENRIPVIEDGAHALGAEYKGKRVGAISDMTIFSFHPVKHITTGEGGAITTDSEDLYEKLIQFRNHGITRDRTKLQADDGPWYYEQQLLGYNYRMTDIHAALGISQLGKSDRFLQKRKELAALYHEVLREVPGIRLPSQLPGVDSSWHIYVILLELDQTKLSREKIFREMVQRKIGVMVHYVPVYYHPYYRQLGYQKGLCPNAEKFYEKALTLPLFPKMDEEDVKYVVRNLREIIGC